MDFKSIMSLFHEDDWAGELVEMLDEMLELSGRMLDFTMSSVINGAAGADAQTDLYGRDKRINELMRKIRRRVVTRLSVGGRRGEVPTALIFMNAVKDAERIGDYVKNLYEIGDLAGDAPDRNLYRTWLGDRAQRIAALIDTTREAFSTSDDELAAGVIADARKLGKECEAAIREITGWAENVRDAVCLVLALRFFKRVVSHLSNIATTVVMPVDLLDFHDEH
jgi:phosphate uptake regulator